MTAFEPRYNAGATPFDWRFTPTDLAALLARIQARQLAGPSPTTVLAA